MVILLLFFLVLGNAASCHPQCTWACDAPSCNATCQTLCQEPVCTVVNSTTCPETFEPTCHVQCPAEVCEMEGCPQCEVICQPVPTICNDGVVLCEAANCTSRCTSPTFCPHPLCTLQCEQPACPAASAGAKEAVFFGLLLLVFLL